MEAQAHQPTKPRTLSAEEAETVATALRRYWGFDALRPLQDNAIAAALSGQDSLVVLPTGGGKSLCYQLPPLVSRRTDIVVSPLISLMKDQVDTLMTAGYPAAALHSALTPDERRDAERRIASGSCRLVFVAPERLVLSGFRAMLRRLRVQAFSIDEAHCISHWGHDFRPEYRQLALLKEEFPDASVHAFTATATERVRRDIAEQLQLRDPAILVGRFDRPNLTYRIVPRRTLRDQVAEVLERHAGQAVIIYCISRRDTERLAEFLASSGYRAAYYHAGMEPQSRRRAQEAFTNENIDVIVATVAFGMGIDRSDVRCVVHAATPKSIEHYQQETGRAGRDGLEAECVLFASPADTIRWKSLIEKSTADAELIVDPEISGGQRTSSDAAFELLDHMRKFCSPGTCRHKTLSEYFGQSYENDSCGACDICLGECENLVNGTVDAQKILSCVYRVHQRFGVGHVSDILRGANTDRILECGHDELSTYGLMKGVPKATLTNLVYQLLDQDILSRSDGEYPVLLLNTKSREVLQGQRQVWFVPTQKRKRVARSDSEKNSWEGVDRDLFEELRSLRTRMARQRGVPPYVIFGDASLRDMARLKPTTPDEFRIVHGVGEKKLADYGDLFLEVIAGASS